MRKTAMLAVSLGALLVSSASADARPTTSKPLYNPQQVADAMFPALNKYWKASFDVSGLTYRAARYYSWYNKSGNDRWITLPSSCDVLKPVDGRIWGGYTKLYSPNSYYCPANEQVYLDWNFLSTIGWTTSRVWGRGRDSRVALVMAHEYGHHIQKILKWPYARRAAGQVANFELQADCYAGVFFGYGEDTGLMERGDTLSALTALGYLGDADGTPWSEQSAHGGHSDRQEWFEYGYDSQKPADCDAVFQ